MPIVANFPFLCILFAIIGAVICSVVNGKIASYVNIVITAIDLGLSLALCAYMVNNPTDITYMMGHFPAPWGNEIRFGPLEALLATVLTTTILLIAISERKHFERDIKPHKLNLFYIMLNLVLASVLALIYTNDIFTAYVFIEINTLCACGLVMARDTAKTIVASIKYLIMSLLGSGLFLVAVILLYDFTGHLLMVNMHDSVILLVQENSYILPLTIISGLIAVAIAIKCALFPFHSWLPHAYSNAMNGANAISSGLILKSYIILLVKIFYRVLGVEVVIQLQITNILFMFGLAAMIIPSFFAYKEYSAKRLLAYSSAAQIGYIFVAIGLGTTEGYTAAFFIIMAHTLTKSMLFVSLEGLMNVSGGSKYISDLRGSAYRNPLAGFAFTIGAFSMIGFPLLSGFASKLLLSTSSFSVDSKTVFVLIAIAISTILNALYYMKVLTKIYKKDNTNCAKEKQSISAKVTLKLFIIINLALGIFYQYIVKMIELGLKVF